MKNTKYALSGLMISLLGVPPANAVVPADIRMFIRPGTLSKDGLNIRESASLRVDAVAVLEPSDTVILCGFLQAVDPDNTPDAFQYVRTIYGSDAWGPEQEYDLPCFEAEAYNEPRPQWW
jgi:hypothetical protein